MERNIITIDQEKCTGCGMCIPNCPEGAIQVIDGKARLVSDLMCDGLGACLGHCPEGAITIEKREAEAYDEDKVMANIAAQGSATVAAHLRHLREHGQDLYYRQAREYCERHGVPIPPAEQPATAAAPAHDHGHGHGGCPGARSMTFADAAPAATATQAATDAPSRLTHWPVQLHLLSPSAPHFRKSDLLLAADCTAFALGNFHESLLRGRTLAIACPKLDDGKEIYQEKLTALIDEAGINTLTVAVMEVPCCSGLLRLALDAAAAAGRRVPVKCVTVGIRGDVQREEWVAVP